jgi:hypothetical protein
MVVKVAPKRFLENKVIEVSWNNLVIVNQSFTLNKLNNSNQFRSMLSNKTQFSNV